MKENQLIMKTKSDNKKDIKPVLMISTRQTTWNRVWCAILWVLVFGGCRTDPPSNMSIKDLIDLPYGEIYVNIRCAKIGSSDTVDVCYPYHDILYSLAEDSLTQHLCKTINNYLLGGEVLMLPENHFLLQQVSIPDPTVDSVFMIGYKQLLHEYFFCHNELDKERSCCLDWLHSACGNSVYFGHRSTPCYYRDGDDIMEQHKQHYIISLLYKNNIWCMQDENGNICLLNCNLKKEYFYHIPFPIVEIR